VIDYTVIVGYISLAMSIINMVSIFMLMAQVKAILDGLKVFLAPPDFSGATELASVTQEPDPAIAGLVALLSEDIVTRRAHTDAIQEQNMLLQLPLNTAVLSRNVIPAEVE
jgi:hypothetical protein